MGIRVFTEKSYLRCFWMAVRMRKIFLYGMCIFIMLVSKSVLVFASAPCNEEDLLLPKVSLILKSTFEGKKNVFYGTFELENKEITPLLAIPGRRVGHDFFADYPNVSVEFKDLNGKWVRLQNHLPGSFLKSPNQLSINAQSKAIFKTELFPKSMIELSGSDFRLILELVNPSMCIVSNPFRAFPVRIPVRGFETMPVSISSH